MSEVLRDFEAIHLLALPTEEAVQNQTILDALIKQVNEEEKRQKEEEEAARSESLKEETAAPPLWFRKGDTLEYADGQQCVVAEVHMDDFPHVYYTVRMLSDGGGKEEGVKEKQTVHEKLRLLRAWEPLPEDQGGMHLRVDWAGVNFSVHGVDPAMSVAELKVYIERCCPQPSSLRINQHTKLVCKGSTLPDKKLLSSTKIKGGSKLMLIG